MVSECFFGEDGLRVRHRWTEGFNRISTKYVRVIDIQYVPTMPYDASRIIGRFSVF
jgi:hypothetical protein